MMDKAQAAPQAKAEPSPLVGKIDNLRYVEATKTLIDMNVTLGPDYASPWHEPGEVIPFTYHPDDGTPLAAAIKQMLAAGTYKISPFVAP